MKIARFSLALVAATSISVLAPITHAGDWGAPDPKTPVEYTPDTWEFGVAPYGFLTALDGSIAVGNLTAGFDMDFGDILNNLDFAAFVATAAKKGNFSIYNDFTYAGLSPGGAGPNGLYNQIDLELDMFIWNGVATYRIIETEDFFLELGGGVRFMYLSTEISAHSATLRNRPVLQRITGLPSYANSTSVNHVWDGVGALRFGYDFSDRWLLRGYGDVGAGDSDLTWQATVNVGYVVNEGTTIFGGYRHLEYEVTQGNLNMNMAFSGPQLGVAIKF